MRMKMYKIADYQAFSDLIEDCNGPVYVVSKDGNCFNLRSKLAQYVALATLFRSDVIDELELEASDPADAAKLFQFMMRGGRPPMNV